MGYSEHTARGAGHLNPAREQPQGHEGMGSAERGTGGSPTHALGSTGGVGRPMHASFEPVAMEAPPRSSRGLMIGIGVGVLLLGFGVVRSFTGEERKPAAREPSVVGGYLSEQQRLMRDAIDMARAAQELQREHMRRMQEEMSAAEFGYAEMGGGD